MRHLFATTVTVLALAASAAHAQTFYSSLSAFNAAANTTNTDFNGIATAGNFLVNPSVLVTPAPGRITFSVTDAVDSFVFASSSTFASGAYRLSDGTDSVAAGYPFGSASTTTIALGGSYTAFAIDYGMAGDYSNSFTFALFNDGTQVGNAGNTPLLGGNRFFGATSAITFNNVRVTAAPTEIGSDSNVVFDNARVGSAIVAAPEAGTLALLLPTLVGFGAVVANRKRK